MPPGIRKGEKSVWEGIMFAGFTIWWLAPVRGHRATTVCVPAHAV